MRILLVDDEVDVMEGILDALDFAALGFSEVHTARSAHQARELLREKAIDVMVTDIEMPGESGLALLKWVRDSGLDTITLFCTCFANFNYAQKAVEMRSFDYLLKPFSYDKLAERLAAAAREAREKRAQHRWMGTRDEGRRAFWEGTISGRLSPVAALKEAMEEGVLSYPPDARFALSILSLGDGEESIAPHKQEALWAAAKWHGERFGIQAESTLPIRDDAWCSVFLQQSLPKGGLRAMYEAIGRDIAPCARLRVYYGLNNVLPGVRDGFLRVRDLWLDDVLGARAVCALGENRKADIAYALPELPDWERILEAGRGEELRARLHAHLDRQAASGALDRAYLKRMGIDVMQMIQSLLMRRQISAHPLFPGDTFDILRERSLRSVPDMKRYLDHIVQTADLHLRLIAQSRTLVGTLKDYIDAHLHEDVNRKVLAGVVFLNPDYLARLFKKETGQSIGGYLLDCRVREAKRLLTQTCLPVKEVALKVGYDNFSYFSQTFRDKTGMAPNEYRKRESCVIP